MLSFLPIPLKGVLSLLLYALNTIFLTIPLILISLFKFIIPIRPFIVILDKILISIATLWIGINSLNSKLFCKIDWDIRGLEKLEGKDWYLIISNHQSWVDILVLQKTLNQKIPMLKFFLKKELIWIPFLGLAWWGLDFPFMKRYSKKQLQENPHLKGKDLEITKKACEKFKHTPVSVMNFVEGTRFTLHKKASQNNNLNHLLTPKAGGIAFVLSSMGEYLHKIIDVTIVYPDKIPTFWEYISGRVNKIIIDFEVIPLTESLTGDYFNDPDYKDRFCIWLNALWQKKDRKIKDFKA
ncbi:MAG: acyltransferase [Deltaproteobacteria bacterium]|uniref:acyltransferase n=1 Tax=Desulfobacula sp. TaxID=2593537 RepID=UPI0019BDF444|nr:acyltransferase [Candidatus Desulfobacula maris]MBL6993324.1 acyltransferase [Desulfobacula sp.]